MMAILDDVLAWTQTLPKWQQDAARRLFQKAGGVSDEDYTELYMLLRAAHGLPTPNGIAPSPLSKAHLPETRAGGDTITLKAMRDLKHVNCIAPDQVLTFEPTGMTVIYGGNGSGKSGYARVMKRACRARDEKEEVLPDANDPAAKNSIPNAIFDIDVGGTAKSVSWNAKDDAPKELASIAVFDSHCARVYVTSEQEAAYLPYGLDVVEALANVVLPELGRRLDLEISGINTDFEHLKHLKGDTEVGRLIDTLSHKTRPEEIDKLAKLSKEELERIKELDRTLGEADPASKANQLRQSAERIKELVKRVEVAAAWVDEKAVAKLKAILQESLDADRAEQMAAELLISGESLLPGTGERTWKALFEAARKFSVERAYSGRPFPNAENDALCLLCQQPLQDAADRMRRFEKYIQDDVAKTAAAKKGQLDKTVGAIKSARLVVDADGAIADELDQLDPTVLSMIEAFEASIDARRTKILAAVELSAWDTLPELTSNPRKALRNLRVQQYCSARGYLQACDEATTAKQKKELAGLAAREKLSHCEEQVLSLRDSLKNKNALKQCKKDLKTQSISKKSKEFASAAITSDLKNALDTEFETMGIGHIKTKLKNRSHKGKTLHRLLLDVATSSKVEDILSEGEQRAIALGSFLAELRLAGHSAAIVFDDPVSSLDHRRRGRLAKRLADESRGRQVIIFTHDVVFLSQLQTECRPLGLSPGLRFLEWIDKRAGVIQEGLPWDHKGYKERIDCLEKEQKRFEKLPWPADPPEELTRKMIGQYNFLRATIERVVQDFVLNATVKRFEDYIHVDNLKKVVGLEKAEVDEICRLYTRCHGIVDAHDPASAKDDPPPTADEFGRDIKALKTVIDSIRARRKK